MGGTGAKEHRHNEPRRRNSYGFLEATQSLERLNCSLFCMLSGMFHVEHKRKAFLENKKPGDTQHEVAYLPAGCLGYASFLRENTIELCFPRNR